MHHRHCNARVLWRVFRGHLTCRWSDAVIFILSHQSSTSAYSLSHTPIPFAHSLVQCLLPICAPSAHHVCTSGFAGSIAEAYTIGIDDNLSLPVAIGLALRFVA